MPLEEVMDFGKGSGGSAMSWSRGKRKQKCHESIVFGATRPLTGGVARLAPWRDCEPYNVFLSSEEISRQPRRACTAERRSNCQCEDFENASLGLRLIDSGKTHSSLVFMPKVLMKFSLNCSGDLHLKSHFYEGQDHLFLDRHCLCICLMEYKTFPT